ncbi:MAG: hypothetical protein AB7F88_16035 [Pyrinomonadaceae bacterium]
MGHDRKRAIALKAADARELIGKELPVVLKHMSRAQVEHVQKVLDAAVVNPVVQQEYKDALRRSIVTGGRDGGSYESVYQNGRMVLRDVRLRRRADRIFEQQIPISEKDKQVRLNFWDLLTADALTPRTNNPDEAEFYFALAEQLEKSGVWLRFTPKRVRDPEEPSSWIIDPRNFEVWLSYGAGRWPDPIPTKTGLIDQKSLLGTTPIGAAFYERVHQGPFMRELSKAMAELFEAIQDGEQEHLRQEGVRATAAPLVPTISDWLGGAEFSSPKVWKKPFALYMKAWDQRNGGDVLGAVGTVVASAILTEILQRKLNEYINRTVAGAGRAVGILEVIVIVSSVADIAAPLLKMGARFFLRQWVKSAVTAEARGLAKSTVRMEAAEAGLARRAKGYMEDMTEWMKKNPDAAASEHVAAVERMMRKWKVKEVEWMKVVPGPKGQISGTMKGGHSSGMSGLGMDKFF